MIPRRLWIFVEILAIVSVTSVLSKCPLLLERPLKLDNLSVKLDAKSFCDQFKIHATNVSKTHLIKNERKCPDIILPYYSKMRYLPGKAEYITKCVEKDVNIENCAKLPVVLLDHCWALDTLADLIQELPRKLLKVIINSQVNYFLTGSEWLGLMRQSRKKVIPCLLSFTEENLNVRIVILESIDILFHELPSNTSKCECHELFDATERVAFPIVGFQDLLESAVFQNIVNDICVNGPLNLINSTTPSWTKTQQEEISKSSVSPNWKEEFRMSAFSIARSNWEEHTIIGEDWTLDEILSVTLERDWFGEHINMKMLQRVANLIRAGVGYNTFRVMMDDSHKRFSQYSHLECDLDRWHLKVTDRIFGGKQSIVPVEWHRMDKLNFFSHLLSSWGLVITFRERLLESTNACTDLFREFVNNDLSFEDLLKKKK